MKNSELYDAVNRIDEKYIDRADELQKNGLQSSSSGIATERKTINYRALAAAVAAVIILVCIMSAILAVMAVNGTLPAGFYTPAAERTPGPTPEITSAVSFLNKKWVILRNSDAAKTVKAEELEPGQYYCGPIPGQPYSKYELLILDEDQSLRVLSAQDITQISYDQSRCLPFMLRWKNMSVIDVYSWPSDPYTYKAYYYYLENSTVIILIDAARTSSAFRRSTSAWMVAVPAGEEGSYPFSIPAPGTTVTPDSENAEEYAPYYDELRAYMMQGKYEPVKRPAPTPTPEPTPEPVYEPYMKNYRDWMDWRAGNPEEYEAWKLLSYPQKEIGQAGYEYDVRFRINDLPYFPAELFRDGDEEPVYRAYYSPKVLPLIFYQIVQYQIPKEELLEYVKWQNWSDYFETAFLSAEDVEALYSGDEDLVRSRLKRNDAFYFEGFVYSDYELMAYVSAYDISRMISKQSFDEMMEGVDTAYYLTYQGGITEERLERIIGAWDEYERISKADTGPLGKESAARVLGALMELYKELRYSPDVLAGEPLGKDNDPTYYSNGGVSYLHFSKKPLSEIYEEVWSLLTPELFRGFDYEEQLHYWMWEGQYENSNMVYTHPKYYNGPIELFDADYSLADHISIVFSDESTANVILTARKRDGSGEAEYTAEFAKIGGRWVISGGTVTDLIAPIK